MNSKSHNAKLEEMTEEERKQEMLDNDKIPFMPDEDPEDLESQKEDMKVYLDKLNRKIEHLVTALKHADDQMQSIDE